MIYTRPYRFWRVNGAKAAAWMLGIVMTVCIAAAMVHDFQHSAVSSQRAAVSDQQSSGSGQRSAGGGQQPTDIYDDSTLSMIPGIVTKPIPIKRKATQVSTGPKVLYEADFDDYLDAIAWVESRNRPLVGKDGELGPWQITRDYWREGLEYWNLRDCPGYEYTMENCSDRTKVIKAVSGYALRYAMQEWYTQDYRRLAEVHHGMNKPAEVRRRYADRVMRRMAGE